MLTLYTTPLSANGRKVLALARHLAVPVLVTTVNVYRGEGQTAAFRAINPSGRVPVLVDGDFVLTESNAILAYLSERRLFALFAEPRAARGHAALDVLGVVSLAARALTIFGAACAAGFVS